jgi:hypothetical protein
MFKRLLFLSVMSAAVGVPYLASTSSDWLGKSGSSTAAKTSPSVAPSNSTSHNGMLQPGPLAKQPAVEGHGANDLAEVIQFEGSPAWVMSRWPRVTAGLAELDLQGYRVALVSGTTPDAIAGSLTYYFDKNQRVAYINFRGTTGDPRKLVSLVTSRYNFTPQQTTDPALHLYQAKWNGKPISELRVRSARVLRADQPNTRYEVDLAMKRPS